MGWESTFRGLLLGISSPSARPREVWTPLVSRAPHFYPGSKHGLVSPGGNISDAVYDLSDYYDIAFDFRDVAVECDTLQAIFDEYGRGRASFIEFGCGPGRHAVEMARRGVESSALDLSAGMIGYAQELASRADVSLATYQADMRAFELPTRVDSAALLMDSWSHLLTDEDGIRHLHAVATALESGGTYVVEMAHPSNHFGTATAGTSWTMQRGDITVATEWGQPDDAFDALTQIDSCTVVMTVTKSGKEPQRYTESIEVRRWTKPHFEAVVELSGVFDIVAWLGSLTPNEGERVPLSHEKASWRMIPVLRKT